MIAAARKTERPSLRILLVSSEVVPYSKSGGLADVAGALPKYLARRGHEVRVVTEVCQLKNKNPLIMPNFRH